MHRNQQQTSVLAATQMFVSMTDGACLQAPLPSATPAAASSVLRLRQVTESSRCRAHQLPLQPSWLRGCQQTTFGSWASCRQNQAHGGSDCSSLQVSSCKDFGCCAMVYVASSH